jgi:hypothetical protein
MRQIVIIFTLILVFNIGLLGQTINQDSVFKIIIGKIPAEFRADIEAQYDTASIQDREFILLILSMPTSSKAEQIRNLDSNLPEILKVREQYSNIVPWGLSVYVEFNAEEILLGTKENIDIRIMNDIGKEYPNVLSQEWNLDYNSQKLDSLLNIINWDIKKLLEVKTLLQSIHCISIENGNPTTIGFARSGMGKYSYKIFDFSLTSDQIKDYNNGCEYIYYKENLVLEYGGGAIGPQCFPDEE